MTPKLPLAALLLLICAMPATSLGQAGGPGTEPEPEPEPEPQAPLEGDTGDLVAVETRELRAPLSVDRIDLTDGLPQGSATAIVQDPIGYVWIGTEDGLARYDGHNMRTFRSKRDDPTTMLGNWVTDLAIGPQQRLWVGTHDGVSVYDPDTGRFTRLAGETRESAAAGGVNDIHVDEKGVWLATLQGGIEYVDPNTLESDAFRNAPLNSTVTAIAESPDGSLWLGTELGLIVFNPDNGTAEEFTTEDDAYDRLNWTKVTTTYTDSSGLLWIGGEGDGAFVVDPEKRVPLRHFAHMPDDPGSIGSDHITAIFEDLQHRMWIGTVNGLSRLDRGSDTFIRYEADPFNPQGLPGAWIESIFQDRGGVLWLGMNAHGIALFDDLRLGFPHYRTKVTAMALHKDPDGTIWAGATAGSGLYKFDPNLQTQSTYMLLGNPGDPEAVNLGRARIWGLHRSNSDELWIGTTDHGLIRFNTETEAFKQYTSNNYVDMTSDWIWDFWEAPDGRLWMATWGGGLVVFDKDRETFSSYGKEDLPGLTSSNLYKLYADPQNTDLVWLGTGGGGLCRLDRTSISVECFQHDEEDPTSISSNNVTGIYRSPDGPLWITTHGEGLNRLNPKTGEATHFNTGNSAFKSDTLYAILDDDEGKLWISSANGLYKMDPDTEEIVRYGSGDGLQSDEFALMSAHKGPDGNLLFGGTGGFSAFDPKDIAPDEYVPPVAITGFRSFGEDIPLESPIWNLPPVHVSHSASFEFEFAALAFANPGANRFAYKLEGFDGDWIEGRRFASYGRLDGGEYTLKVRAANRHGAWNEEGVELQLHVAPAPWRTWWAYSLYGLSLLGALVGYRRYNQQKLARIEQKTRLEAVERDLELTGAVQHGFLPKENAVDDGRVRIYGYYRAAEACGGDWWWHEQPAQGIHQVLVGDVTGHGPGPAMVTAAVGTGFRIQGRLVDTPIPAKMDVLTQEVLLAGQGKYHMTMAAVELSENDGKFTFYSAGSMPLLRLKRGDRAKALPCRGTPLGSVGFELGSVKGRLEPGERLLLYTDGIPEVEIAPDRLLGIRRFAKMFEHTGELGLEEALTTIVRGTERLRDKDRQDDDWTLVVIEWG